MGTTLELYLVVLIGALQVFKLNIGLVVKASATVVRAQRLGDLDRPTAKHPNFIKCYIAICHPQCTNVV
ncbi:uncharacterized protein N7500_003861 [Penicillium coprophilum]|uniref:uncharacterized protein n=1 Tax=Penicillium coprophilum TaxID=36646 RepID=UPI0023839840|nr:uncharacterized protein N7500_003861 [Penicillium coprophilum]KAJ5171078.1 hypothetical protein N7500_003861 [Penicillium coprophilum]